MGENEIQDVTVGPHKYDGVRVTDDGPGYIELREKGAGTPVGRISYHGPGLEMDLTTYGAALPRSVVMWLLDQADFGLA